jgi:hypothetical protein
MKKITLTITLITVMILTISAKSPAQIKYADLIGSWQHKTTYVSDDITCYLKTDDYLFYGDNECVLTSNMVSCSTGASKTDTMMLKWRIVANTVLFYNQNNSIVKYFPVKNNVNTILLGEKIITDTKNINYKQEADLFSMVMN